MFLGMIDKFKNGLAEDDEEEKSVIEALEHVMVKVQAVNVSPETSFSLLGIDIAPAWISILHSGVQMPPRSLRRRSSLDR